MVYYAYKSTHDEDLAKDMVQDAFIVLSKHLYHLATIYQLTPDVDY